jgi:hypothetical protein
MPSLRFPQLANNSLSCGSDDGDRPHSLYGLHLFMKCPSCYVVFTRWLFLWLLT